MEKGEKKAGREDRNVGREEMRGRTPAAAVKEFRVAEVNDQSKPKFSRGGLPKAWVFRLWSLQILSFSYRGKRSTGMCS